MLFTPPFLLRNTHVQTVFSSIGPRRAKVRCLYHAFKQRETPLILECGQGIRLAGVHTQAESQRSDKLVILLHGWEGSIGSSYMLSMAASLLRQGIDVFRLNLRDHGDTHHLNRDIFNSTMIDEVISAIEKIQQDFDYQQYYLVGFSLGGNFSLRVAAMANPDKVVLDKVIVFCPVIHAKNSNRVLNQEYAWLYGRYFRRKWKRSLRLKLMPFPDYEYAQQLDSMSTLDDMNYALIPQYTPYQNLDDYFDAYAISGDKLRQTLCPCYLHFSKDDMIIPYQDIKLITDNPDLHITLTEYGGHCGFLKNWKLDSWQDQRALQLINMQFD